MYHFLLSFYQSEYDHVVILAYIRTNHKGNSENFNRHKKSSLYVSFSFICGVFFVDAFLAVFLDVFGSLCHTVAALLAQK